MIRGLHWANLAVLGIAAWFGGVFLFANDGEWFAPRDEDDWVTVELEGSRASLERRSCTSEDCIAELRLELPRRDWNAVKSACLVTADSPQSEWPCFAGPRLDYRVQIAGASRGSPITIKLKGRGGEISYAVSSLVPGEAGRRAQ